MHQSCSYGSGGAGEGNLPLYPDPPFDTLPQRVIEAGGRGCPNGRVRGGVTLRRILSHFPPCPAPPLFTSIPPHFCYKPRQLSELQERLSPEAS
jgi:hypothetical protein